MDHKKSIITLLFVTDQITKYLMTFPISTLSLINHSVNNLDSLSSYLGEINKDNLETLFLIKYNQNRIYACNLHFQINIMNKCN